MKNKVYTNASLVTGLSVAERSLGFLYRILLSRLIGAEGLGLYQVALSLFALFLTLGTGGIPITVSRMITKCKAQKNVRGEQSAVGAGVLACLCLTLPICLILGLFGGKMSFLFTDGRAFPVFRILLLGLCFSSVYAVIRGSWWGNKEFLAPSIVEIAEETVMVLVGVALLQHSASPLDAAIRAAWAVVISYLFSFGLSTVWFLLCGGKIRAPKQELKPLFASSLPITAVRASGSLVTSAVAVLFPLLLINAGFSHSEALQVFGVVSGMVLPVLFVPSTVIGSLALVLVPELSEDFYRDNRPRLYANISRGLKFSFLFACLLIPFFFVLGGDLGALAFSNQTAGEMIRNSCLILLPISLTMISNAILNSMGFEKQTFLFYFIGAAGLLLCILFLPALCGGYAYLIGLFTSFTLTALCNLVFLFKKCPIYQKRGWQVCVHEYFPALFGVLPIALFGEFLHAILKRFFSAVPALIVCAIAMSTFSLLFHLATEQIPMPRKRIKKKLVKNA